MASNPLAFSTSDAQEASAYYNALRANGAGEKIKRVAQVTFDPSANAAQRVIGTHYLDVGLPKGAIVQRSYYRVLTTFTSATGAATISLGVAAAGDIKAAVAINDGANPYDAGLVEGIQVGTMATAILMPANGTFHAVVAVENLTAGKLILFTEYVLSE